MTIRENSDKRVDSGEVERGSEMPGGLENGRVTECGSGSEKEAIRTDEGRSGSGRELDVKPGVRDGIEGKRLVVFGGGVVEAQEKEPRAVAVVGVTLSQRREGRGGDNRQPRFAHRGGANQAWNRKKRQDVFGHVGAQGREVGVRVVVRHDFR